MASFRAAFILSLGFLHSWKSLFYSPGPLSFLSMVERLWAICVWRSMKEVNEGGEERGGNKRCMSSISKKLHCICKTLGFGSCRCSMGSSHMYPATDMHVVAASWPLSTGNCPRVHCSSRRPWNTVSTDPAKGASVDCLIWPLHILTRVGDAFHTNQLDHDTDQTYFLNTEAEHRSRAMAAKWTTHGSLGDRPEALY